MAELQLGHPRYMNALEKLRAQEEEKSSPQYLLAQKKLANYDEDRRIERERSTEEFNMAKQEHEATVMAEGLSLANLATEGIKDPKQRAEAANKLFKHVTGKDGNITYKDEVMTAYFYDEDGDEWELNGPTKEITDFMTWAVNARVFDDPQKMQEYWPQLIKAGVSARKITSKAKGELEEEQVKTQKAKTETQRAQTEATKALTEQRKKSAEKAKEKGISDSVIQSAQKMAYADAYDEYDRRFGVYESDPLTGEESGEITGYMDDAPDQQEWIDDFVDGRLDKYIQRIQKYRGTETKTEQPEITTTQGANYPESVAVGVPEELTDAFKNAQQATENVMQELPDPTKYKGKTIRDTKTGKRYKSDGTKWNEVK